MPTLEAIRTAINADSAVKALVAAGNDVVVAAALNDGRFPKLVRAGCNYTEGGLRELLIGYQTAIGDDLTKSLERAKAATDGIKAAVLATPGAEVFWAYADPENPKPGIDLGSPFVRAFLGGLAGTVLTVGQAAFLLSVAEVADVVQAEQIGLAMRGPSNAGGN